MTVASRISIFAYFMLHLCLWIFLDAARNIPIFSWYFRQHYRKIKLQFDVLKLTKRKRTANPYQQLRWCNEQRRVHSKMYALIRNWSTYAFLHIEVYHLAFPLEKSPDFYCNVHSVRLLASALAYLSSDVYRSVWDYLATVYECSL